VLLAGSVVGAIWTSLDEIPRTVLAVRRAAGWTPLCAATVAANPPTNTNPRQAEIGARFMLLYFRTG